MKKKCKYCGDYHKKGGFNDKLNSKIDGMFQQFLINSAKLIYKNSNNKSEMDNDDQFQSLLDAYNEYYDYRDWERGVKNLEEVIFKYNN